MEGLATASVLVAASLGALAAAVFLVPFRAWFGFTALRWPVALTIAGITIAYLMAAETGKHVALAASEHAATKSPGARNPLPAQDPRISPRSQTMSGPF